MGLLCEYRSLDIAALVVILTSLLYFYVKYAFSYWERRGVKSFKPSFPFGDFSQSFLLKRTLGDVVTDIYKSTKQPFLGLYGTLRPILMVQDTELIQKILIKDFQHFTDRGVHCDESYDPLSAHLFALPGQKWRNLRNKLSPAFTSGKLKSMFSTILDCGAPLEKYIDGAARSNKIIEIREIGARFTTNIIASVAFGLDIDCFANPDTEFRKFGRKAVELSIKNGIKGVLNFVYPTALDYFKIKVIDPSVEKFVRSIVNQNLEYREKNNVVRKDLFQLLVQLRNNGTVELDDQWQTVIKNEDNKTLTVNEIAAQVFVFYLAGFETSSSTTSFCIYELAKNPEIQQKVHEELDRVYEEYDGKLTYEAVNKMKYLEWCIDETLRKYPIVPLLNRECTKEYQIPDTNVILEKGTQVFIPVMGLHHDEQYYPEPDKFIPERFNEENSVGKNFLNRPYLGFGDGPRICIGMRLGKLQTKIALILMLKNHFYELSEKLIGKDLIFSPSALLLTPIGGIELRCKARK